MTTLMRVAVVVTVLWRSPEAPRAGADAVITADNPDHAAWLAGMDASEVEADNRHGLDGRIETEVLRDEPVLVHDERDGFSLVTLPWQPSTKDERGYPGWVRSSHLTASDGYDLPAAITDRSVDAVLAQARSRIGIPYLWGGVCPQAIDCSGLVHLSFRSAGVVVPRDAHDQHVAAMEVPLGSERPGDLYFFAQPGKTTHHIGFVAEPGILLHAPQTGASVVEERMTEDRRVTLVGAGRVIA